jgi:protein tyrosine phosphatase type 4A
MLKKKHVQVVVRACEPTYNPELLERAGIRVVSAAFSDGEPPPPAVITTWLGVLKQTFPHIYGSARDRATAPDPKDHDKTTIAIHCIAGLGRAPVLVAIGLAEAGMDMHEAIALIRSKRRGAFNSKQLKFLTQHYTPQRGREEGGCCAIM